MAACVTQRLRPHLAKLTFVSRNLHCSTVDQSCGPWRVKHGLPVNPSMHGPLTDLPDWTFADGRPAPPMKRQLLRKEKNKELARRVVMLSKEIDHGIEKWEARQREKKQEEEAKQLNKLQPKGGFLPRTPK
ncbi:large ribosomal subunit protein mL52 [Pogona vitticeps]|uniref:Large ribosomal subunit protein mL52 n=1 Tax=Pogona vitticeps TaxID=103695 RepID=A0A6J0UXJ8_9SAUR